LSRYLDIARGIADAPSEPRNLEKPEIESADARKLSRAGWEPKVSFGGVVIWEGPDTGYYVSEEMALCLLDRWTRRDEKRGNREGVTQH